MFGIPRFGQDRIREEMHRFGARNPQKTRLAAERSSRDLREEGERKQAELEREEKSQTG